MFESNELYTFYSNHSCIVNFTLTENNPYDDYDRIILKPDNITNTDPYISQGMINDKDVTIQLGNNGVMEIFN